MTTMKQRAAARKNIRKAQARWKAMTPRQHATAQPEGRKRQKPGTTGKGEYYHIAVRPKQEFVTFRNHDVGERGHVQRLVGKRASGTWDTVKWLISKGDAHLEDGTLIPDTTAAKKLLATLGSKPVHVKGDLFKARPKPTAAKRARR